MQGLLIIIILLNQDYKVHWHNNKIPMTWLTSWLVIIIIQKGWLYEVGREQLTPFKSEDPSPTIPTHRMKENIRNTVGDTKGGCQQLGQKEDIAPSLETRQSHTIEYGVKKIVPQRY